MSSEGKRLRRIVLVSSSLGGGGAERVLLTMAEYWSRAGHTVTIVTLRSDLQPEYEVPTGVTVVRLKLIEEKNPFWHPSHPMRLWKLREGIVQLRPDVVISFIDKLNAAVLLALAGTGIPVVATEHLAPWMNSLGGGWERMRRFSYRRARAVISPTEPITRWFAGRGPGRYETLPYPSTAYTTHPGGLRRLVVVAVGRLTQQKGFDVLVDAFSRIAGRCLGWNVEIAGEGPERKSLERQVLMAELGGRVKLLGQVRDIAQTYQTSEIFVLSSRHEAYPMALCEAISAGCCVIATDCPTGPREIIGDSGAGVLIPPEDARSLATEIERLIQAPQSRLAMRQAASRRTAELHPAAVMRRWDAALDRWIGQAQ